MLKNDYFDTRCLTETKPYTWKVLNHTLYGEATSVLVVFGFSASLKQFVCAIYMYTLVYNDN